MSGVNRAIILGNVGKAPVIRVTQSGSKIASFSIATSEKYTSKTGEKVQKVQWHNISVLNDGLAGIVEKYVTKGSKVYVSGQIETRKWTDQSGVDRYSTEIVVKGFGGEIVLLGGNNAPDSWALKGDYASNGSVPWDDAATGDFGDFDDRVPF